MIFGQPIFLKPADGQRIRKEDGQLLADAGETVIASSYWQRRVNDGDVLESDAADLSKPKTTKG